MDLLVSAFVFVFGAVIGSFLNVVVARWNTGLTIGGRSRCFACRKVLRAHELVPVLSFFAQLGRCRSCRACIPWRYPIVEIVTGLAFLAIYAKGLGLPSDIFLAVAFSTLIVIAVYDLRHTIIPDQFVYFFILLGFLRVMSPVFFWGLFGGNPFDPSALLSDFLAGPVLALPFALLWYVSRGRWMGLGDAKLAFGIGWLAGFDGGFAALVLAFWIGAVGGLVLMLLRGKRFTLKSEIPFGPFLALAVFIVFYCSITFSSLESAISSAFM